jgi:hypothetical protein
MPKISGLNPLSGRMKTINCLIQNKRRIAKCLYLAAAIIEQLPDLDGLKKIEARVISRSPALRSPTRRGKRSTHK